MSSSKYITAEVPKRLKKNIPWFQCEQKALGKADLILNKKKWNESTMAKSNQPYHKGNY